MSVLRYFFASIFFWTSASLLYGQVPKFHFENISSDQKLSHNTIVGLLRDSDGFLWIATMDGLNRYDGYTCKVYKHNSGDSSSLSVNFLHTITEDRNGFLWIGTRDGGLNKLDKRTEKFIHFRHDPYDPASLSSDKVNSVVEDQDGNIWVATEGGLNRLLPSKGTFTRYVHNPEDPNSLSSDWITAVLPDSDGSLWISTLNGLNRFDPETKRSERFYKEDNENSLAHNVVTTLYKDQEQSDIIWIGTRGGLHSYSKGEGKIKRYADQMKRDLGNIPININAIISYNQRYLLIATEGNGLLLFDKKDINFTSYTYDPEKNTSVSSNIVSSMIMDNQGLVWLGTWGGGVDKLTPASNYFRLYNSLSTTNNLSFSNSVFAIAEERGVVWLGTKSNVLIKLNRATDEITNIPVLSASGPSGGIGAICLDQDGNLWFGSNGLGRYDPAKNSFNHFNYDPDNANSIGGNDIKCIVDDAKGSLWIGTEDGGVSRLYKDSGHWTRYLFDRQKPLLVRTIYLDREGNAWFGTYKHGIIRMNIATGDTTTFLFKENDPSSISNNDIRHIMETRDNQIWVATYGGGINMFDRKTGKFLHLQEKDGLSNNFTYGILEDNEGNLWISTNYGISRYNRKTGNFQIFTQDDGLQNNEFNTGAFFRSADGELFFGGISGFNSFHPEKIQSNKFLPPVFITNFKIFDKEVKFDTSITYLSNIVLSHADKFFAFEFTALNFLNSGRNRYAYKLIGFDEEWIESSERRFASYTNLDPGDYRLRIKASNNDGLWNETELSLGITITPPFWQAAWFRICTSFFILFSIIATVRYYSTRKLKQKIAALERERLVQKERERISRDLHDNVGAHLTFLISSIDNLAHSKEAPALKTRISELSTFGRKTIKELRNTIWAMKHDDTDLQEIILKLNELKQEVNSSMGQGYLNVINSISGTVRLRLAQALNIFRIVQEAVQNAVKSSGAQHVEVSFSEYDDKIIMVIKDNGKGFDPESSPTGNGLINMKDRCEEVNGVFEISSNPSGTVVTCTFEK